MHGNRRKILASAGEQEKMFALTRPYDVLAVPGLDSTFSAPLRALLQSVSLLPS